jgi:glucosamine-6-phosphate isomerase
MNVIITSNYSDLSSRAAEHTVQSLAAILNLKDHALLVPSSGSTPSELYRILQTNYRSALDWSRVVVFQMDEYAGMGSDDPHSYARFLHSQLLDPLGIQSFFHFNDSTGTRKYSAEAYGALLREHGGIDLMIHGIGENGHLGFNEPGADFGSRMRVLPLTESTRKANHRFFTGRPLSAVPVEGITLGLADIAEARENLLIIAGSKKHDALIRTIEGEITPDIPATVLRKHPATTIICDEEALEGNR